MLSEMILSTSRKIMIFVLVVFISLVSCQQEFYIKPSLSDACSEGVQCLTLSQFTATNIYSNVTLKFYPGNHTLSSMLMFKSNPMVRISKKSNHSANSTIQCTHSGRIDFIDTAQADIYNMEFRSCGLQMNHTYHVDIINSTFLFNSYGQLQLQRAYFIIFDLDLDHEWRYGNAGVIVSQASSITLFGVSFERNRAELGAAIFAVDSVIEIRNSSFKKKQALCVESICLGGVLYSYNSTITIQFSNFHNNSVDSDTTQVAGHGGVFALFESLVSILCNSYFSSNVATKGFGGVIYAETTYINITTSSFLFNRAARSGGVIQSTEGMFVDINSHYEGNIAYYEGGVMSLKEATSNFTTSKLLFNNAQYSGGAVSVYSGTQHFYECEIFGNIAGRGSAISVIEVHLVYVSNCNFTNNRVIEKDYYGTIYATYSKKIRISDSIFSLNVGGVLSVQDAQIYMHNTILSNNTASLGVIYFIESTCIVSGFSEFTTNIGSILSYSSNVTITGNATFINSHPLRINSTTISEGGVITAFQSEIILGGLCNFKNNFAESGGAVYATESHVYITGNATLSHNTAEKNGGAIFLYQSHLECQDNGKLLLLENVAGERGGAIHAISSSIRTIFIMDYTNIISQIIFTENHAIKGGAVSLEVNAKLYIFIKINFLFYLHTVVQPFIE